MRFLGLVGAFVMRRVFRFLLLCCPLLAQAAPPLTVAQELIIAGIDAAGILYVFTWGMGAVLSMWAIGYAAGVVVAAIKAL